MYALGTFAHGCVKRQVTPHHHPTVLEFENANLIQKLKRINRWREGRHISLSEIIKEFDVFDKVLLEADNAKTATCELTDHISMRNNR